MQPPGHTDTHSAAILEGDARGDHAAHVTFEEARGQSAQLPHGLARPVSRSRGPMLFTAKILHSGRAASTRRGTESLRQSAHALGWVLLLAGSVVLIGWFVQGDAWARLIPGSVSMKANTALGFAAVGLLLLVTARPSPSGGDRRFRSVVLPLASAVALLGGAHWAEHLFRVDLGIDELLAADLRPDTPHPGRMAQWSAVSFVLMGSAFLLMNSCRAALQVAAQGFALIVFCIGYVGILGYLFDAASLYRIGSHTAMSIQAAGLFELAAIGFLLTSPDRGVARIIASHDARGVLLRRLLPAVLVIAPAVGWLQIKASQQAGSMDAALVALANVIVLVLLLYEAATAMQSAITAREQAEMTLRESAERLNWALQAAGGGAWDWDLLRNKAWWSSEMYELWHVDPETRMRFENSMEWIDPRDREQVAGALARAIDERTTYRCEFRIRDPSGQERWMESRGRAIYDDKGRAIRMLGISIDVSTQKEIEMSLRRAKAALEHHNIELQRFAYVASHDLQTPLRSIASYAELLQTRYSAELPPQAVQWLGYIATSVANLQMLVRDLLQYSRIDAGTAAFAAVAMSQVFERVLGLLQEPIRGSNATVTHSLLPIVNGDGTQLAQVFQNLIDNALRYRGADAPIIHVSAHSLGGEWQFCVSDNGIGIEERHFERVFEMFERLHTASEYEGTGMGLAICRRIVQRHGGRIWLQSAPGQGSKFFFTLPQVASEAAAEHP